MNNNPISVDNLIGILAQGYLHQSLAYEDLAEQTEKKLQLVQEQDLNQAAVKEQLAQIEREQKRLMTQITNMNEKLDQVKNQIAVNMGETELSLDKLLNENPGQSTFELEKVLQYIGQLMGRIQQAEQELAK